MSFENYAAAHQRQQEQIAKQNATITSVEIFKVGTHTPMSGRSISFSQSMLTEIVDGYDIENHHAPVVIGHPKTDAPAYGWVSQLRLENGNLVADFSDVDAEFVALVKAKRYKKISASFYEPNSPSNPTPEKWSLKHVGFLGAASPAVKGLKEASFAANQAGIWVFGETDIADLPQAYIEQIQAQENRIQIDSLVREGRVLPFELTQVLDFANSLSGDDMVSFSDGEELGKRDWFLNFLSNRPAIVNFGKFDMSQAMEPNTQNHSMPNGFTVDPDQQALQVRANELAKEKGISFETAVQQLGKA